MGIELETLILCTGDKLSSQIKNFNCTIFTHLTADTYLVLGQKLVKKQMFKVGRCIEKKIILTSSPIRKTLSHITINKKKKNFSSLD